MQQSARRETAPWMPMAGGLEDYGDEDEDDWEDDWCEDEAGVDEDPYEEDEGL